MWSRTSCAATSGSLSSVNVMMTSETPWLEVERSSSMPLIVLTAPSILSVTLRLDFLGRGARSGRRHDDCRKVDLGELIDPERPVAEDADHDENEHEHPREDGLPDAQRR